jgi:hypothetical protein
MITLERVFQIAAVALAGLTAYFLYTDATSDTVFAFGVMACVAFFLSVRSGAKRRIAENDRELERRNAEQSEPATEDR